MKVPCKEISVLARLAFLLSTLDRCCECMRKITFDLPFLRGSFTPKMIEAEKVSLSSSEIWWL